MQNTPAHRGGRPSAPSVLTEEYLRRWTVINENGCWVWQRGLQSKGYAKTTLRVGDARICVRVHRVAYELFVGPIPDGLQIDHLCRNRACVNPQHLEPVTAQENFRRGNAAGALALRTNRCCRGHEYNAANTAFTRDGARRCRACGRIRKAARKAGA